MNGKTSVQWGRSWGWVKLQSLLDAACKRNTLKSKEKTDGKENNGKVKYILTTKGEGHCSHFTQNRFYSKKYAWHLRGRLGMSESLNTPEGCRTY